MRDSVSYIGTATCLLRLDGRTILVDPSFLHASKRYHLGWGVFSTKLVEPVVTEEQLREVEMVLVTHTHRDHFDEEVAGRIDTSIPVITNSSAVGKIRAMGFSDVTGLGTLERAEWGDLTIAALPAAHGPWYMKPFTGSVTGFGITTSSRRIWVSGDTVSTTSLKTELAKFDPQNAVVYFGGVRVYGIRITFDGRDALKVMNGLESLKQVIAVHTNDWSHFRTDPIKLEEVLGPPLRETGCQLVLPEHGSTIHMEVS